MAADSGIAVFVKTPGITPVKTRLACGIGQAAADRFYALSLRATESVIEESGIHPWWAVAEKQCMTAPVWKNFDRIFQGEESLGARLSRVYETLRAEHRFVMMVGADSPQIRPELIHRAVELGQSGDFVLGPAKDGGFWLFGGSRGIPESLWLSVPYSQSDTFGVLSAKLSEMCRIQELPILTDVDEKKDLDDLRTELVKLKDAGGINQKQKELLGWLENYLSRSLFGS